MFFHNSGSDLLDGSYLAAAGNIIVVTASFRVAAFGFLSTGTQTHTKLIYVAVYSHYFPDFQFAKQLKKLGTYILYS